MIPTNRQDSRMLDNATGANHVFGGASSNINDQRPQLLMLVAEQRQGRCQTTEHNVVYLELKPFDRANCVLQTVEISMDDMDIDFDPRAKHSDWIGNSILAIDKKMLANCVDNMVLSRQIYRLGILNHILDVVLGNLAIGRHDWVHAAVIEPS